ncbi:MAG TPA: hypothetical protein VJ793_23365 [Anaerolineae bacterium]|nr:hypothetical protein [Anaerolineae bacterium]
MHCRFQIVAFQVDQSDSNQLPGLPQCIADRLVDRERIPIMPQRRVEVATLVVDQADVPERDGFALTEVRLPAQFQRLCVMVQCGVQLGPALIQAAQVLQIERLRDRIVLVLIDLPCLLIGC